LWKPSTVLDETFRLSGAAWGMFQSALDRLKATSGSAYHGAMSQRFPVALSVLVYLTGSACIGADDVGIANSEARAHYRKALEYADRGLWSPEILELNRALELEPRNPAILVELGTAYGERKDWTAAVAMLRKAVAMAPTSVQAHYSLALTLDRANPGKGSGIP